MESTLTFTHFMHTVQHLYILKNISLHTYGFDAFKLTFIRIALIERRMSLFILTLMMDLKVSSWPHGRHGAVRCRGLWVKRVGCPDFSKHGSVVHKLNMVTLLKTRGLEAAGSGFYVQCNCISLICHVSRSDILLAQTHTSCT